MLCDVCKSNEATVFLTQIVNGKVLNANLCEACSKQKGMDDPTAFALADLMLGMGAAQEMERGAGGLQCPVCGFSQADFKKTGRLGCSNCYDVFYEGLSSLLKAMHRGTQHTGKAPAGLRQARALGEQMKQLQEELQKAVRTEDYETAAGIRDQIRDLEKEIKT